jgi:hypothetical protein
MLFVVAVFYLIITRMFGITRMEHYSYSDMTAKNAILVDILNWMIDNPEWGMMFVTLMFVIPTWFFFRFAPRHSCHTFAEGILIQIYMATIVLIATFISYLTEWYVLVVLSIVYYYFTYRQLFGYRFWGTLWRLLLSMVVAFWGIVLSMSIVIYMVSSTLNVSGFFRALAIIVVVLSAGYLISRRTAKNRLATDDI